MIIFDKNDKKRRAENQPGAWSREGKLDEFLFRFPEALSDVLYSESHDNRLIPLGRQLWNTDLLFLRLGVTEDDQPALVVCENKLARNPELVRKVLAQTVDYVSRLCWMDDDRFTHDLKQSYGTPGVRDVLRRLRDEAGLDESDIEDALEAAITAKRNHRIEAVICAEAMPEPLIRMAAWLNRAVRTEVAQSMLPTCEVRPIDDEEKGLVALATTVAQLHGTDTKSYSPEEERRFCECAAALWQSPTFQVAVAEVKSLGDDRVALQEKVLPIPTARQSDPIRSADAWLNSVPTPEVKALYESLIAKVPTQRARWRPGGATGSQLCLWVDVNGLGKPVSLLRLKKDRIALLLLKKTPEFRRSLGWAREQAELLGAAPMDSPQPSLGPERVRALAAEGGQPIVDYILQYIERIDAAVAENG